MATINEIIERVDENKPNAFSTKQKTRWIAELDGKIALEVFLMNITEARRLEYTCPDSLDSEPLVGFPHDGIYDAYLEAKIDYANGEYDKYQNSMEDFNAQYGDFARWFANVYEPAQGTMGRGCPNHNIPTYYISAYGLAVKQGYEGTMEEWLASLKGDPAVLVGYNVEYQVSNSGTEIPTEEWSETIPDVEKGNYLWTRVTQTFDSGTVVSYSVSYFGIDGNGPTTSLMAALGELRIYVDETIENESTALQSEIASLEQQVADQAEQTNDTIEQTMAWFTEANTTMTETVSDLSDQVTNLASETTDTACWEFKQRSNGHGIIRYKKLS